MGIRVRGREAERASRRACVRESVARERDWDEWASGRACMKESVARERDGDGEGVVDGNGDERVLAWL